MGCDFLSHRQTLKVLPEQCNKVAEELISDPCKWGRNDILLSVHMPKQSIIIPVTGHTSVNTNPKHIWPLLNWIWPQ